jgi:hypothetical protein
MTPEENLARITEEVNEQMRRFGYILPETNQRLLEAQTGIQNFGFKVQIATGIMGNLADAVGDYTQAMYRGEKGAAVFNHSIDKMVDAAQTAAVGLSLLTPGGALVKGLAAGITFLTTQILKQGAKLTETANIQSDNLYNAFSQIAESGAVGADGMQGLFEDIQKLGLNVNKLDRYLGMVGENADELALMGGTVLKGRKQFSELGAEMAQYEVSLRKLGMNEEEQAAALMAYARTQNRVSQGTIKDFSALSSSAYNFMLEQDALAKVTGLSRKQQQQAYDEAMRNERFVAAQKKLERKFGGPDSLAMRQVRELTTITKSLGERTFKGFQDMLGGQMGSKEATDLLQSSPELFQLIQKLNAGQYQGNQPEFEKGVERSIKALGRFADTNEDLALYGKSFGVGFIEANKAQIMSTKNFTGMLDEARAEQKNQIDKTGTALDQQANLRKVQNDSMLTYQAFIETGIPNLAKNTMQVVAKEFQELVIDLRKKLGSGTVFGTETRRPTGPQGVLGQPTRPAIIDETLTQNRPGGGLINPSPDQQNPPPGGPRFPNPIPNPYTRQNPLPVDIVGPASVVNPPPPAPEPRLPGGPRYDPFNPPLPDRAHGTAGELGSLFEPKDIIAQLHKGERVLNKNENADLTKLFNMVSGEKSQKKMLDTQSEMLKVIDSITSGMRLSTKSGSNKNFDAAFADVSSGMPITGPVQKTLIDGQAEILNQLDSFMNNAMPASLSSQTALLDNMPKLEIDKEAAAQISQSLTENMGNDFKTAVANINRLAEQLQNRNDVGLQQQMVGLLEDIRRSQQATAKASERLAQVASN